MLFATGSSYGCECSTAPLTFKVALTVGFMGCSALHFHEWL